MTWRTILKQWIYEGPPYVVGCPVASKLNDDTCMYMCMLLECVHKFCFIILSYTVYICDRACENQPYERKLHRVIFSLMSYVLNALSHFHKLQKKAH